MKKLITLFLLFFSVYVHSQIIDIPDANFKDALVNQPRASLISHYVYNENYTTDSVVDTNGDGEIQVTEAEAVYGFNYVGTYTDINSFEGIQYFTNLEYLNISYTSVSAIDISDLVNLKYFGCRYSELTNLDVSNNVLIDHLSIYDNNLSSIDVSQLVNLRKFQCDDNNLTSLNLDNNILLENINCSDNSITAINFNNNINLSQLTCYNNLLSILDLATNIELDRLFCDNNNLTTLDLSNNINLDWVHCEENQLASLNVQNCTNLTELNAGLNQLTSLDLNDNINLDYLALWYNEIESIDLSNNVNLITLYVYNNQLTTLDVSNNTNLVDRLWFFGNPLETLNLKNGITMSSANYNNGNGIYAPELSFVCVDEGEILQIQDLINDNNVTVSNYCTFDFGHENYLVNGEVKRDVDNNGCDENDIPVPYLRFNITDDVNDGALYSNASGDYNIYVSEGIHTVTPIFENLDYYNIEPTNLIVDFPDEGETVNQNFCFTTDGEYNDLEIVMLPLGQAQPGFDADYKIMYKNKGTTTLSGTIELNYNENDGLMNLVSATPEADSDVANVLTWSYSNLQPFETREILVTFNLNTPMDEPPLNGGDELGFVLNIFPFETDETPNDNNFELKQIVVNSFDPNDKTCLQGATIKLDQVGDYVHYLIRFENNGTANAINIAVVDEIDIEKYDVSSLIPLDGSHDFVTRIKDENVVEFIFENINLAFDDANNDGYVLFKIKTLETLGLNDTFENEAEIYFDFNFPIYTNIESTTVVQNLSIDDYNFNNDVQIFPNPTSHHLNISSKKEIDMVKVYDITGQLLRNINVSYNNFNATIEINKLSTGIYFLEILAGKVKSAHKVVKN